MSAPAGWYPDPQPPPAGSPPQQRYWDGQGWTAHLAPVGQQPAYAAYPTQAAPAYASRPQTPDGAPLAGWWHRVGAYLIDIVVLGAVVSLLTLPFIRDITSAFGDYFDAAMTAAENGDPVPSSAAIEGEIASSIVVITIVSLAVSLGYTIGFLMWKQATPGKLAVGLRIRLRESPELPVSAILTRWATQSGAPGLFGLVPVVGIIASVFTLLDALWPLWDSKNQALHDKVAKTNVVRTR